MRPSGAITNTSVTARLACWPHRFALCKVHALVKDRHRSREFIEFLELSIPLSGHTAIKLILDNHSATSPRRPEPGSPIGPPAASNSPSHQTRLLAQPVEGFFPSSPAPSCAHPCHLQTGTQGSHHGCMDTSTTIPSSTHGPTTRSSRLIIRTWNDELGVRNGPRTGWLGARIRPGNDGIKSR